MCTACFTWAERLLKLSPPGGTKTGSDLRQVARLPEISSPACQALIKRFSQPMPSAYLSAKKILKIEGTLARQPRPVRAAH